jgi:HNH endonuclease
MSSELEELKLKLLDNCVEMDGPIKGSPCLVWTRSQNNKGYGNIWWKGRVEKAHRMSWTAFVGPIPDGLHCLHHCDWPGCIRLDHLYLGTNKDNVDDRERRGRANHPFGEAHGNAVITELQASEIKWLVLYSDYTLQEIANWYDVRISMVSDIKKNHTWAWLEPREPPPPPIPPPIPGFVRRL